MAMTFLLDGPLMLAVERRQALVKRMAKDLMAKCPEGLANDREAVRALFHLGYSTVDVAILAGEARMLAYQEIVAAEMSKP